MRMMMKMMDLIHCHFGLWDHKLYDFAVQFVKLEGALVDLQILLLFWLYFVNCGVIFE